MNNNYYINVVLNIDTVKMKIADLSLLNEANTVSHLIDTLRKRYARIYLH
jgi:hypothetical protein